MYTKKDENYVRIEKKREKTEPRVLFAFVKLGLGMPVACTTGRPIEYELWGSNVCVCVCVGCCGVGLWVYCGVCLVFFLSETIDRAMRKSERERETAPPANSFLLLFFSTRRRVTISA